jgi:hypothetical protein
MPYSVLSPSPILYAGKQEILPWLMILEALFGLIINDTNAL